LQHKARTMAKKYKLKLIGSAAASFNDSRGRVVNGGTMTVGEKEYERLKSVSGLDARGFPIKKWELVDTVNEPDEAVPGVEPGLRVSVPSRKGKEASES